MTGLHHPFHTWIKMAYPCHPVKDKTPPRSAAAFCVFSHSTTKQSVSGACLLSPTSRAVAAAAAVACAAQSGKLLCDYAWRSACHTLAPLADDVRRKRYLHACLATVRFDAENLLADRSVQTT